MLLNEKTNEPTSDPVTSASCLAFPVPCPDGYKTRWGEKWGREVVR